MKDKSYNKKKTRGSILCVDCADKKVIPFHGFKTWNCKECDKRALASSKVIPVFCHNCSNKLNVCEQCGALLNEINIKTC